MSLHTCIYCSHSFKTNVLLKRHQTTVKYCLKLQEKKEEEDKNFICNHCKKEFTTKQTLNNHINICRIKFQNIILQKEKIIGDLKNLLQTNDNLLKTKENLLKEKDDIIIELKAKLEIYEKDHEFIKEIAKQPKTQNNTVNNNNKVLILSPFNLTQNDINVIVNDKFTKEHFLAGQKGVAKFTSNNILKDDNGNQTYMCTDSSRNIFNYKNKEGQIEKDIKAVKLTETISPAVITKSEKIYKQIKTDDTTEEYMKKLLDIKKMNYDNDKFVNELCILTVNSSSLALKNDDETEIIEDIIEEYTDEELQFMENMRIKKQEALEKLESLKEHTNQNLYNYHKKMYIKKYGDII